MAKFRPPQIGIDYGSLSNYLYATYKSDQPKVGDRAVLLMWTDRCNATVIASWVDDEGRSRCQVREHTVVNQTGNYHGAQSWITVDDPTGSVYEFMKDDNGLWYNVHPGTSSLCSTKGLFVGVWDHYQDPSF